MKPTAPKEIRRYCVRAAIRALFREAFFSLRPQQDLDRTSVPLPSNHGGPWIDPPYSGGRQRAAFSSSWPNAVRSPAARADRIRHWLVGFPARHSLKQVRQQPHCRDRLTVVHLVRASKDFVRSCVPILRGFRRGFHSLSMHRWRPRCLLPPPNRCTPNLLASAPGSTTSSSPYS